MSEWSHLPNAHHIDRIIKSVKSYPEVWAEANANFDLDENYSFYLYKARSQHSVKITLELDEPYVKAWRAARDAAYNAAYRANKKIRQGSAQDAARIAAWDAITALVAHDDAAKYLDMTSEQLKAWAILSEDPPAILLLPAVTAFEQINKQKKNLDTFESSIKYILNYLKL